MSLDSDVLRFCRIGFRVAGTVGAALGAALGAARLGGSEADIFVAPALSLAGRGPTFPGAMTSAKS